MQTNLITLETVYGHRHSFRVTGTRGDIIAAAHQARVKFAEQRGVSPYAVAVEVSR